MQILIRLKTKNRLNVHMLFYRTMLFYSYRFNRTMTFLYEFVCNIWWKLNRLLSDFNLNLKRKLASKLCVWYINLRVQEFCIIVYNEFVCIIWGKLVQWKIIKRTFARFDPDRQKTNNQWVLIKAFKNKFVTFSPILSASNPKNKLFFYCKMRM